MSVQLVVPGLFDLPLEELEPGFTEKMPALNRILRLATAVANRAYAVDEIVGDAIGLPSAGVGLPVARAFAGDSANPDRLILAEAIHLRADMHNAIAIPVPSDPENREDIETLMQDMADLFRQDFELEPVGEGRYLMSLQAFEPPAHYVHPLSVLGKNVSRFVEQSRQVLPWYKLLNELQMFLHQHPVNQRRLQTGRLPVNSLWTWGAGTALTPISGLEWYGEDAVFDRFAQSLELGVGSLDAFAARAGGVSAVVLDLRLLEWLKAGLDASLEDLLADLESRLFAPAMRQVAEHNTSVRLRAGFAFDFELAPIARLKFWRRSSSLSSWRQAGIELPDAVTEHG